MAAIIKLLTLALFLGLIAKGNGYCTYGNIQIAQSPTGKKVQGQPEWNVTVSNQCVCTQLNVKLDCKGFQTLEIIDPSTLKVSGGECLLNNGQPIYGYRSINFKYARGERFPFQPKSSQIACS